MLISLRHTIAVCPKGIYLSAKIANSDGLTANLRTFNLIFLNYYRSSPSTSLILRMASTIFSSLVA